MLRRLFSLAVLTSALLPALSPAAQARPNILLILADDMGYGDIGRHGHPLLKTPNLDALHDQGVRFENFCVSPSCSPTRAALLTGIHEFRNGVTHTTIPREHLHSDAVLLPQLLKTAGYRTGFIGKWHLGNDGGYAPQKRGFDWCSTIEGGGSVLFDPTVIRASARTQRKGFREDIFFDEAMDFIADASDQPFFCYLATYSPHVPLAAPESFVRPYKGRVDDQTAAYLGMVANIDFNIGRIREFLRQRGLEENTIVIFMNDNGATCGLELYNAGMRGCKCTIWQGGTRAASFWTWPGKWQPHAVPNLTAHLDVLPTLCDLAGVSIPTAHRAKLEGHSMRPLLESSAAAWHEDRLLFQHVGRWPSGMAAAHKYAMAAVRQGQYLLVRSQPCGDPACAQWVSQCSNLRAVRRGVASVTYAPTTATFHWGVTPPDKWNLFDLRADPRCENNLTSSHPRLVTSLAEAYDTWWDATLPALLAKGGDSGTPKKVPAAAAKQ